MATALSSAVLSNNNNILTLTCNTAIKLELYNDYRDTLITKYLGFKKTDSIFNTS